jgi:glycosyltransferase involved in cell wall biosynthesis
MRVLHTIDSLAPEKGGTSRSVPRLVRALAEHGVEVDLADAAALRSANPAVDVIHDHGVWLASNHRSATLATSRRVPFVLSPRGMLEPWSLQHHRLRKRFAWMLYQGRDIGRAAMLHATASMEAENLRRLGLRQPIAVVGNGVDIPPPRPRVRRTDGIRTALFLSRIHPKKGLLDLVAAWARVRPEGWRVLIAGPDEGGHREVVRSAVASAQLERTFQFIGEVDDTAKWALYAAADLFVLPSYSENFGTVIAEALASEAPVITTTKTPWNELRTHDCGWWIDPGADTLAAALSEATALDAAVRDAMGARGRALVERRYSWRSAGAEMRDAYEWLLGGGAAPSCVQLT